MDPQLDSFTAAIKEHFTALPPVVQKAITSADISSRMRTLAEKHRLHLDQWDKLENEVLLTLLNIEPMESLAANLEAHVGILAQESAALVTDINEIIFRPIREALERELGHPQAKGENISDIEQIRRDAIKAEGVVPPATTAPAPVAPGTPPPPKPDAKVVRGPASGAYKPGEASTTRKAVTDDPYREVLG